MTTATSSTRHDTTRPTQAPTQPQLQRQTEGRTTTDGAAIIEIYPPTCDKLVVLALGSSGALTWFEPVQPVLALLGIGLLAEALRRRLRSEVACKVG